jgi:hypothetical protein
MGCRYAEKPGVDDHLRHAATERVFEDHPDHGDEVLLLSVAVGNLRADVRHHHLPDLYPTTLQQAVAAGAGRSKDGRGGVGKEVELPTEGAVCDRWEQEKRA